MVNILTIMLLLANTHAHLLLTTIMRVFLIIINHQEQHGTTTYHMIKPSTNIINNQLNDHSLAIIKIMKTASEPWPESHHQPSLWGLPIIPHLSEVVFWNSGHKDGNPAFAWPALRAGRRETMGA